MTSNGVGELVFIEDIMDKWVYLDILKTNVKKGVEKLNLVDDFVFQQYNDPKHTFILYDNGLFLIHYLPLHNPLI